MIENRLADSPKLLHAATTFLAVAIVGIVLLYTNLTLQRHISTFLGGSANTHCTQGWPVTHRTLVLLEKDPESNWWPELETKILDSEYHRLGIFSNMSVGILLCLSVYVTHRIRNRNKSNFKQLDLISLFFLTTILAMLALRIGRDYQTAREVSEILDIEFKLFSMPNLLTFLPIVYAVTCAGFVIATFLVRVFRRTARPRNSPPIAG